MKKLMLIIAMAFAAPFAYAGSDMVKEAASEMTQEAEGAAEATAEAAEGTAEDAVEIVDKGTQASPEQPELSRAEADDTAQ